jgi:hypothetical protein
MNKMYLNVIHRADAGEERLEALQFQQEEAHKFGFKTTILMSYRGLLDKTLIEYVKQQKENYGDEIGIHFHEMMCEDLAQYAESKESALYLHSQSSKASILTRIFDVFFNNFGFIPAAIGGYILDASLLRIIKEKYPQVETAITNCFEEGVKMFEGNNNNWHLFSDGGPWGPYYPSKANFLCPAADEEDAVGIVGLPHLNRDMVLALTSRDDYFASHPINVVRAKANVGGDSPYIRRFIDQWIEQAKYNGFSYYSLFVSSPWVAPGNAFVDSLEDARSLYTDSLRYLRKRTDEGLVEGLTIGEFGRWYKENVKIGQRDLNLWKDILCGSKRQTFWYVDPYMRAAFDMNSGGSICDLRPYAGKLERDLGPDTEVLWNGNYPFAIATEHRTGSFHSCKVSYNGKTAWIHERRTQCSIEQNEKGETVSKVEPVTLTLADIKVKIQSTFAFTGEGQIEIERKILEVSEPHAEVELEEFHKGCWGTTQYPEDMRNIVLSVASEKTEKSLDYKYRTRIEELETATVASAAIPQLKVKLELVSRNGADRGGFEEGFLFNPYYTLFLRKKVSKGGSIKSCLKISRL